MPSGSTGADGSASILYPYDFFNAIAEMTGRDLSWFWSSWLFEAWPVDQAIESVSAVGDSIVVVIADRGLAPMPVLVAITRADGTVQRVEVPVDAWLRGERGRRCVSRPGRA